MTPGARVGAEYIGLARRLRQRCEVSWKKTEPEIERLLAPLRPKPGLTLMPTHDRLRRLASQWRRLPGLGRIRLSGKFEAGRLVIAELRAVPMTIAADGWDDDEKALGLLIAAITAAPPADLREVYVVPIVVGLHALSRRYERSLARDDKSVFADLLVIARHIERDSRGFNVAAPSGGSWVGLRAADGVFTVRTYIDN